MLAYADIVFTSVFTAEIVLKVIQSVVCIMCLLKVKIYTHWNDRDSSWPWKNNNNCSSDDNLWRHPSQRLFLPELFQHLGSLGGQCLSAVNGHGVSDLCCHTLSPEQIQSLLNSQQCFDYQLGIFHLMTALNVFINSFIVLKTCTGHFKIFLN